MPIGHNRFSTTEFDVVERKNIPNEEFSYLRTYLLEIKLIRFEENKKKSKSSVFCGKKIHILIFCMLE